VSDDSVQKRLSAILAADVAGYTRLMEKDSDGTVAAWQTARSDAVDPSIAKHAGRIVKLTGDGFLAEFATVQDAVECAITMQQKLVRNALNFRMGVNLGDIIDDGQDIHGEGVNIAARIEALADPGGICISGSIHEQVRNRLNCQFEDMGEHEVKHVSAPVRVYRVSVDEIGSVKTSPDLLTIPDKVSIAVLPFDNMSGDPEQEYFVDGVVEDILTTLSKIEHLFVIARNSSFAYKGQSVDIRTVGAELGVRYVLEGGVRKSGNRVRLTAQLIDCEGGQHVWAERYDGVLDDVFELQDRITQEIVTALEIKISEGEQVRIWRERSGSPLVYEHFHKARVLYLKFSKDNNQQAQTGFEKALSVNPDYIPAIILLGFCHAEAARFGWTDDVEASWIKAMEFGQRAIDIDPEYGHGTSVIGYVNLFKGEFEAAVKNAEKSVALSLNNADTNHVAAMIQIYAGNASEGIRLENHALRLNPLMPTNSQVDLGRAYIHAGEFQAAKDLLLMVVVRHPQWITARTLLVAALSGLGEEDDARQQVNEIMRINPRFSADHWATKFPYQHQSDLDAIIQPLKAMGL